jgi:hypothetical protein
VTGYGDGFTSESWFYYACCAFVGFPQLTHGMDMILNQWLWFRFRAKLIGHYYCWQVSTLDPMPMLVDLRYMKQTLGRSKLYITICSAFSYSCLH